MCTHADIRYMCALSASDEFTRALPHTCSHTFPMGQGQRPRAADRGDAGDFSGRAYLWHSEQDKAPEDRTAQCGDAQGLPRERSPRRSTHFSRRQLYKEAKRNPSVQPTYLEANPMGLLE